MARYTPQQFSFHYPYTVLKSQKQALLIFQVSVSIAKQKCSANVLETISETKSQLYMVRTNLKSP